MAGQGPDGADLYVKLHIAPHPYFRREGKDIILEAPISAPEAMLGTKIDVPTLDGERLTVKVPAGASSGSRLRLRGRGVAGGDQYIELKIVAPAAADGRERELIEEFMPSPPAEPARRPAVELSHDRPGRPAPHLSAARAPAPPRRLQARPSTAAARPRTAG